MTPSSTRRHTCLRCPAALPASSPEPRLKTRGCSAPQLSTKPAVTTIWKLTWLICPTFKPGCIWPTLPIMFLRTDCRTPNWPLTSISRRLLSQVPTCRCKTETFTTASAWTLRKTVMEKGSQETTANFISLSATSKKPQSTYSNTRRKLWSFKLVDTTNSGILILRLTSSGNKGLV